MKDLLEYSARVAPRGRAADAAHVSPDGGTRCVFRFETSRYLARHPRPHWTSSLTISHLSLISEL